MKLILELIINPSKTVKAKILGRKINLLWPFLGLLIISLLDLYFMFLIGSIPGGNPCLWLIVGGLLDFNFVQELNNLDQWLLIYPTKIIGDIALIYLSGFIAYKYFGSAKNKIKYWFKTYCYLAVGLDIFLILSMLPVILGGESQKFILITHLLGFLVFGANILLFTNAYRLTMNLRFDQAYKGFFISVVAIPIVIIASLFFIAL
ncbi:MAG: hypothetical protein GF335_02210 [Candidatus Moranbacteria bacterium]|nr:hypothetical protein [Candidatus Moranbacteria bacterium]